MSADQIQIGKYTLESLTTGMYSDPESCYREYIQNAVDSFDAAISQQIIKAEDCRIEIVINNEHREISIKDNGTGIKREEAEHILLDIGNSTKLHSSNRGFRGIGRLGGLSYCKKLNFCTSACNENIKTIVSFDCEKLKELLIPGQNTEHDLQSVMSAVTDVHVLPEQSSAHYFIVKMENVDDISSLLDIDLVRDYISQVAPVPFKEGFFWRRQIKEEFMKEGLVIPEYSIFVGASFEELSQVFKPYKLSLNVSTRSEVSKNSILGLNFYVLKDLNLAPLAYGWYADTEFSGTLVDDKISGIRVRQGNIMIGTSRILAPFFKESRFNAWSLGELYVVSDELIPNARRDDFERNEIYSSFEKAVRETIGTEIAEKIRTASKNRNNPIAKTISKTKQAITSIENVLNSGFNSSFEKDQMIEKVEEARKNLYFIPKNAPEEVQNTKKELIEQISTLSDEVKDSNNYKTKRDISNSFSKEQKRIIQAMMEVLTKNFERETVDSLYNEFLIELNTRKKK